MRRLALFVLTVLVSCTDVRTELVPAELGSSGGPGDAGDAGDAEDAGDTSDAGATAALCGEKPCKCSNGKDDDRDELIDGLDPECTSRFDDEENTFATSSEKRPLNACEDCFWDGNASADDDGCAYPAACRSDGPTAMPGGPPMMAPPSAMMCRSCEVTPRCVDSCRGRTPNGCDCFGCCEVTGADGVAMNVVLSDECAVKHVGNAGKCPACVPNPECFNPCGPCELCFGRQPSADCADGGASVVPSSQCEDGYQACSEDAACRDGFYCLLGCCMVTVY